MQMYWLGSNLLVKHPCRFILFSSFVAFFSGLLYGYSTAVIAGLLVILHHQLELSTFNEELLTTSILFGAFWGGLYSSKIANYFGRKTTLIGAAFFAVLWNVALIFAINWVQLTWFRCGLGVSIGILSMVVPLYISEISPVRYRGALVSIFQLAITIGILLAYLAGLLFQTDYHWRMMVAMTIFPMVLLLINLFFLPESPFWLAKKNKIAESQTVFRYFSSLEETTHYLCSIQKQSTLISWTALFKPPILSTLFLCTSIFALQNMSGIDAILYYAPTIFAHVGLPTDKLTLLATLFLGIINVIATVIATLWVDRLGRRLLLLTGLFLMTLSLLSLAISLHFFATGIIMGWVTLAFLGLFIIAFAMSLGPIPFILMSELFPLAARERGASLAISVSWLSNMAVTLTYLTLAEWIGKANLFLLYAIICLLGFLIVFLFLPETKQREIYSTHF